MKTPPSADGTGLPQPPAKEEEAAVLPKIKATQGKG